MDDAYTDLVKYNNNHLAIDSFGKRRMGGTSRGSSKIFFKPHIVISPKKLRKINKGITLHIDKKNVAVFNLNIWTLDVENKGYRIISKDSTSCSFDISIIKNKRTQN